MKLVIKEDEIYNLEKKLLEYISNIYDNLNQIDNIKNNLNWEGHAYTAYINKYNEIIENEKKQIAKLESLIKFLDDVLLNYGMAQDSVMGNYSNVPEFNGVVGKGLTKYNVPNNNINSRSGIITEPTEEIIRAATEQAKARSNYHG